MRNWLRREKCAPIHLAAGDSIQLLHDNEVLLTETIQSSGTIDELGVFTDTTEDGKDMLCGAFIGRFSELRKPD